MKLMLMKKVMMMAVLVTCLASCKKAFEKLPGTELDATQMYRNVYDADAAIMGIYGKFMKIADRYIILNELRADLLNYTSNSDEYLREISTHNVSPDNPYASPRPFYELIINCNDVLKNFTIMYQQNKLKELEYYHRYSDIACLRSFLYLQLGIHYGDEVRYVTDPLEDVTAINNQSLFPKVTFNVLLDSLINFTERIPFKDPYPAGSTLNIALDGAPTTHFFINKKCLLGDLYLWKGEYRKAASYYREVMEMATVGNPGESYYSVYKMGWAGNANHYISYARAGDAASLTYTDGWRMIFERPYNSPAFGAEWIWALPFDSRFGPENSLVKLFSPIGGDYLVKPSQEIIDKWDNQQQKTFGNGSAATPYIPGFPYDARGIFSVQQIGGQPVAMKFLYYYLNYATNLPVNPLARNGRWFLYRQTHMHLHFAEAANREGFHRMSYGFLNSGLGSVYAPPSGVTNVTDYQNTLFNPAPYNFDARNGEIPRYRSPWYRHIGIRNRAFVTDIPITNAADSLLQIENGIIEEGALENAFEGTRWPDLLRVALRRKNDPAFIADKIYAKLLKDGVPNAAAVRTKLMNKANWYLPFKL